MFSVDAREGLRENKRVRKSERHSVMPVSQHVCVCAHVKHDVQFIVDGK